MDGQPAILSKEFANRRSQPGRRGDRVEAPAFFLI